MNSKNYAYARMPTFSEVIDGLACGLGVEPNKTKGLASKSIFNSRVDTYSGSMKEPSLKASLLEQLVGQNERTRKVIENQLDCIETEMTNVRSHALITDASEAEGLLCFIETWAVEWLAQALVDAREFPGSILDTARQLIEMYADCYQADIPTEFIGLWKAQIRNAIPKGAQSSEFRAHINKLNNKSQRKLVTIEEDISNLRHELRDGNLSTIEVEATIRNIRNLYLAGMDIMRFCSMAAKSIARISLENEKNEMLESVSEQRLLELLSDAIDSLTTQPEQSRAAQEEQRLYECWQQLDFMHASAAFKDITLLNVTPERFSPTRLREIWLEKDPYGFMTPAIDWIEGSWNFYHGRHDVAKKCWQKVIDRSHFQQLGETAAFAASALIALYLSENETLKFQELNPLANVAFNNTPQICELNIAAIPTPFSSFTRHIAPPNRTIYDTCLIVSVFLFNTFIDGLELPEKCNPISRFDQQVESMIIKSRKFGARLPKNQQSMPAIHGMSVKPYQLLKHHHYYRDQLFGSNQPDLPGMNNFSHLSLNDQLRVLRYVDHISFRNDIKEYGMTGWSHPDDPS